MRKVIVDLNLNEAWGKKYDVGTFKTWETLEFSYKHDKYPFSSRHGTY